MSGRRPAAAYDPTNPQGNLQYPRARTYLGLPTFTAASGTGYADELTLKLPTRGASRRITHTALGTSQSAWAAVPTGPWDFTGCNPLFWFYLAAGTNSTLSVDRITVDLSSNGGTTSVGFEYTRAGDAVLQRNGEWWPLELPNLAPTAAPIGSASYFGMPLWGQVASQINWAAVTHMRFGMTSKGSTTTSPSASVYLGAVEKIRKPKEAVISFTFDRFNTYNVLNALPILDAAGFKATLRGQVGQLFSAGAEFATLAQIKAAHDNGHDVGVYDYPATGFVDGGGNFGTVGGTPWSDRAKATVISDLRLAQQKLIENGMPEAVDILAGQARKVFSDGLTDVIWPHFNYVDAPNSNEEPAFWPPFDPKRYPVPESMYVKSVADGDNAHGRIKQTIDRAVANSEWLTLLFHEVGNSTGSSSGFNLTPAKFQDIVDYVTSKGVKVRTTRQVMHGQV